jgi:hypothetical protein
MTKHTPARRFLVTAIVAMTITASFPLAQKVSEAELLFREAQHKQQVERDLNGAIKLYESIAASKTADRAVRAKALLQLAGCYETQGRQAEKVYDQIVRDFKDQPAVVAQAQAKLAALRPSSSSPRITKVEFGNAVRNVVATDGKRAVYWNDDRTTLYFGDVAGNARNVVFAARPGQRPLRVAAAPDLSMVGIVFAPGGPTAGAPGSILIGRGVLVNTDGTRSRELNAFGWFKSPRPGSRSLFFEWSGNGRYLLARVQDGDSQMHLAKISVDDGQVTLLPPINGSFLSAFSSPDDRFIALGGPSGLYIIPSQGGEPRRLIAADAPEQIAWTNDGKYLLFRTTQNGPLFALPMKDGQAAGERITIADGNAYQLAGIRGASIVLQKPAPSQRPFRQKLYLASLDDEGRLSEWKAQDIVGTFAARPTWSPDSRQFAYVAFSGNAISSPAVRIHTVPSGDDRVLFAGMRQPVVNGTVGNCLWASTRPLIYCGVFGGTPSETRQSTLLGTRVIAISTDTGRTEDLGSLSGSRLFARLSTDDRTLISFMTLAGPPALRNSARRWEIGATREQETSFAAAVESNVAESPDGRLVYRVITDAGNRREYQIRPTSGSDADWTHLMHVNRPELQGQVVVPVPVQYTPDSKWLLYHDKDASGKDGLYRVSTNGGEPQRLGDYPTSELSSLISVSPDGRKILVHVDDGRAGSFPAGPSPAVDFEYALLENFSPTAPAAPSPAARPVKK